MKPHLSYKHKIYYLINHNIIKMFNAAFLFFFASYSFGDCNFCHDNFSNVINLISGILFEI